MLAAVVEDERNRSAIRQRPDTAGRHVGFDLEIDVVDHGHHRFADGEPGADLGVNGGDDAGIGRLDRGPGEIDLGEREAGSSADAGRLRRADGALGDDHLLPGVVVASLAERRRIPKPFQPAKLLAAKHRLGRQALHLRLRLVDDRRKAIALGPEPDRVEHGNRIARPHAIADLDMELGDRACRACGDLACAPRDQAPDDRHGLRHRLHAHLVDGDHGRRLLGCRFRHAWAEPERKPDGDGSEASQASPNTAE